MIGYIKEIADALEASSKGSTAPDSLRPIAWVGALAEELDRLDPRDFVPAARFELVRCRTLARALAKDPVGKGQALSLLAAAARRLVDSYGGAGSLGSSRSFKWLCDAGLRVIVERDFAELSTVLVPDGAWKSAVIMAGSILEALLQDLLTKDPARLATAKASQAAPRIKGTPKPEAEWTLDELIKVATEIGLLPAGRADTFDQVLRDYRNFVHPAKEIRAAHSCGEGEALMAHGALVAVCDHFDRTLP